MSEMLTSIQVIETFVRLITSVRHWGEFWGEMMNERYFHHLFSSWLYARGISSDFTTQNSLLQPFHPEWPTYKKSTGLCYAKYRRINKKKYLPFPCCSPHGGPGFIDFAIGDYRKPEIGIEFCIKPSCEEDVIYDFVKLMDARNPFNAGLSYTAIVRKENASRGTYPSSLVKKMNSALREARTRLGYYRTFGRQLLFVVSELGLDTVRYWYFDNSITSFEPCHPFQLRAKYHLATPLYI